MLHIVRLYHLDGKDVAVGIPHAVGGDKGALTEDGNPVVLFSGFLGIVLPGHIL